MTESPGGWMLVWAEYLTKDGSCDAVIPAMDGLFCSPGLLDNYK